jgi:hypothetical protein
VSKVDRGGCGSGLFVCAGARLQNEFCSLIDLIAGTRKLSGNFPVDGTSNRQSRRILYLRGCASCRRFGAGSWQRSRFGGTPEARRNSVRTEGTTLIGNARG